MSGPREVYWARIKDKDVVVTDRSLVVKESARTVDITLSHIESLEVAETWAILIIGIVLMIIGLLMIHDSLTVEEGPWYRYEGPPIEFGIFVLLVGLAAAWYGWNNRFIIKIHTLKRTIKLRDGDKVKELHQAIRSQLQKVRLELETR